MGHGVGCHGATDVRLGMMWVAGGRLAIGWRHSPSSPAFAPHLQPRQLAIASPSVSMDVIPRLMLHFVALDA